MESGTTSSSAELEWRRQWKPDLATQVWQQIQIKKQGMLVKFIFRDDCYEILLYDMITMWSEECSKDAFMKKAKVTLTRIIDRCTATIMVTPCIT